MMGKKEKESFWTFDNLVFGFFVSLAIFLMGYAFFYDFKDKSLPPGYCLDNPNDADKCKCEVMELFIVDNNGAYIETEVCNDPSGNIFHPLANCSDIKTIKYPIITQQKVCTLATPLTEVQS